MSEHFTVQLPFDMKFVQAVAPEWIQHLEKKQEKKQDQQSHHEDDLVRNWRPADVHFVNIHENLVRNENGVATIVREPCTECYFDAIKAFPSEVRFCINCRLDRAVMSLLADANIYAMGFEEWQKETPREEYRNMTFDEIVESFRQRHHQLNRMSRERE